MEVNRHATWTALYGEMSMQEYREKIVPKIVFKESVNGDVKKAFIVIENLLIHGYFEYEFLDVAIVKCLQTLEMALKLRYEELNNLKWKSSSNLAQLIKWFESRNYFEVSNPEYMNRVRQVRNIFSHPERYGFGGFAGLHWIETTVDLINDLYEDIDLRKQRLEKTRILTTTLQTIMTNGASFQARGIESLIYQAQVVFINNKLSPPVFTIIISPIFDEDDTAKLPLCFELPEDSFTVGDAGLRFLPNTNQEMKVIPLDDEDSKSKLLDWNSRLMTNELLRMRHVQFQFMINETFLKTRRKFHFNV